MRKFLGLVMCALLVAAGAVFVACSDDDDESTSTGTPVGTYKSVADMGGEVYMIFTINDDGTWASQGYTDATYTETTLVGTIKSGSYVQSGNTLTLSGTTYGDVNFTGIICTTSDNWNTMIFSGIATGKATRQ